MSESILNIESAHRDIAKVIVGLASTSGGGKTYTALEIAHGLSGGDPSKIGFLDTESGRGSLYDDIFEKPYRIAQLSPPYSPRRYGQACVEFAQSGIEVLIVDSCSHSWEGIGGADEIAEQSVIDGKKMKDWITAKREYHRFMRTLLAVPCHLVLCFRAREKTDFSNPSKPVSLGIQPIAEKNTMFEMTVSFMLDNGGENRKPLKKIPRFFSFLEGDGYLTRDHGHQMREWFGGSDQASIAKKTLKMAASQGTEQLRAAWELLNQKQRQELKAFKDTLKDLAVHADQDAMPSIEISDQKW